MSYLHTLLMVLLTALLLASCGTGPSEEGSDAAQSPDSLAQDPSERFARASPSPAVSCPLAGEVLPGNRFYSKPLGIFVALLADSSTRHSELGESHRILEVYDAASCERLQRTVLPVDQSPDFPYTLAQINYSSSVQLLAITGSTQFYLYDLAEQQLSEPVQPAFAQARYGVDAQSGHIVKLEVWENYLIGHAQDYGSFVFQMQPDLPPKAVLPLAEHERETQVFHQAFLLESDTGQQLLLPAYDRRSNTFRINPVFAKPVPLLADTKRTSGSRRFLLLREATGQQPILLDLQTRQQLTLPNELLNSSDERILKWALER